MIVHAGCAARFGPGGWAGALLFGASGVGKSDLMLRLLATGWVLVADDRCELWASEGGLYARAPSALAGLLEVRGLDVVTMRRRELARVKLVVDCVAVDAELDRIPDRTWPELAGVAVERTSLRPLEASAVARVELALTCASRRALPDHGRGSTRMDPPDWNGPSS